MYSSSIYLHSGSLMHIWGLFPSVRSMTADIMSTPVCRWMERCLTPPPVRALNSSTDMFVPLLIIWTSMGESFSLNAWAICWTTSSIWLLVSLDILAGCHVLQMTNFSASLIFSLSVMSRIIACPSSTYTSTDSSRPSINSSTIAVLVLDIATAAENAFLSSAMSLTFLIPLDELQSTGFTMRGYSQPAIRLSSRFFITAYLAVGIPCFQNTSFIYDLFVTFCAV